MTSRELPRVVITTTASVDGRIAMGRDTVLLQEDAARRWATMKPTGTDELLGSRHDAHGATVTLEGSGSFVVPGQPPLQLPPARLADADLFTDWLATRAPRWFVVADSRGRVDWQWAGDQTTALLVLVCRATPAGYLQLLRDRGIGYLVAGGEQVDVRLALRRLKEQLGAEVVVADSGGTFNAALLRAGVVDEIDVVTLPGLVGGSGAPTIMDGPPLGPDGLPIRLELLSHEAHPGGVVRARYRVVRDA